MSNDEIAVHLTAAILQPNISIPSRRESIEMHDALVQNSAEFAVRVYRMVLAVLDHPAPAADTKP